MQYSVVTAGRCTAAPCHSEPMTPYYRYPILLYTCLLCSATPPCVPYPPLPHHQLRAILVTTSRCMLHHCMLLHVTASHRMPWYYTACNTTACYITTLLLYSTSLYFTGSYWHILSTPPIFSLIFCCSLPSLQIDAHMGLVTSIHTHPSSSRAYKNLMLSSSLGNKSYSLF